MSPLSVEQILSCEGVDIGTATLLASLIVCFVPVGCVFFACDVCFVLVMYACACGVCVLCL